MSNALSFILFHLLFGFVSLFFLMLLLLLLLICAGLLLDPTGAAGETVLICSLFCVLTVVIFCLKLRCQRTKWHIPTKANTKRKPPSIEMIAFDVKKPPLSLSPGDLARDNDVIVVSGWPGLGDDLTSIPVANDLGRDLGHDLGDDALDLTDLVRSSPDSSDEDEHAMETITVQAEMNNLQRARAQPCLDTISEEEEQVTEL